MLKRNRLRSSTCRWIFNPRAARDPENSTHARDRIYPSVEWSTQGEFSRIDDRFATKKYQHFWQLCIDSTKEYDFAACGPPAGGLFNCIGHYTWDGRVEDVYWAGPRATFQEPTFIPSPKAEGSEGEGWLIALVNRLDVMRNDIIILNALNVAAGPLATIHLPFKLRLGLHGNFVDHADIKEWEKRRGGSRQGPVRAVRQPLPWQLEMGKNGINGSGVIDVVKGANGA